MFLLLILIYYITCDLYLFISTISDRVTSSSFMYDCYVTLDFSSSFGRVRYLFIFILFLIKYMFIIYLIGSTY